LAQAVRLWSRFFFVLSPWEVSGSEGILLWTSLRNWTCHHEK
jgi:hypothetical protein